MADFNAIEQSKQIIITEIEKMRQQIAPTILEINEDLSIKQKAMLRLVEEIAELRKKRDELSSFAKEIQGAAIQVNNPGLKLSASSVEAKEDPTIKDCYVYRCYYGERKGGLLAWQGAKLVDSQGTASRKEKTIIRFDIDENAKRDFEYYIKEINKSYNSPNPVSLIIEQVDGCNQQETQNAQQGIKEYVYRCYDADHKKGGFLGLIDPDVVEFQDVNTNIDGGEVAEGVITHSSFKEAQEHFDDWNSEWYKKSGGTIVIEPKLPELADELEMPEFNEQRNEEYVYRCYSENGVKHGFFVDHSGDSFGQNNDIENPGVRKFKTFTDANKALVECYERWNKSTGGQLSIEAIPAEQPAADLQSGEKEYDYDEDDERIEADRDVDFWYVYVICNNDMIEDGYLAEENGELFNAEGAHVDEVLKFWRRDTALNLLSFYQQRWIANCPLESLAIAIVDIEKE